MFKPLTLSASIVVLMIALTALPQLQAAPLTIVENGRSQAVIVVEAKQPKAMKAAQALQTYIEKMSGAKLALIEEGVPQFQEQPRAGGYLVDGFEREKFL